MNKTSIMRTYVHFSIVIGLYFLLAIVLYNNRFGTNFHGLVTVTLFNVHLETLYETNTIFNMPLVSYFIFLVLNILVFVLIGRHKDVTTQSLRDVAIYNGLITVVMIASQIVYVYMIPDRIGGLIENNYLYTDFYYTSSRIVKAINLNYVLALIYVVYNMVVSITTMPPKEDKEFVDEVLQEEALLQQFLKEE
ncbi:hypothetical protein [Candidatus Xianfuyuplasma coldseepsis]|uniref:Uncharacterized protein n=1 Tax=Candidatus Xianfuyuplasma coldseepsis TaxID=2782163 RepID=A0A7L7KSA2_9MOLU|nr:hypothetical protein [Xianfuyuplasma coldseepsis]QMS85700.1 hypothetical protein G4Z02_08070 [Xianfuyuplasma coldseepsis]